MLLGLRVFSQVQLAAGLNAGKYTHRVTLWLSVVARNRVVKAIENLRSFLAIDE